ncbi:MAG: hypothetical protein Ta2F_05730 [Termitinemataceae bacterium]|nr:MAG: hypothetical protein Ta2F_05730 [Termitinemataceae bacterium]
MDMNIICCGIFKPELEKIIPKLEKEFPEYSLHVNYVASALHDDNNKLKEGINSAVCSKVNTILMYGSMCHPQMEDIAKPQRSVYFKFPNCIDVFLSKEKKAELEQGLNVHFMTSGWIEFWKDIFEGKNGNGWDPVTARINLGVNDKIIILDTGCKKLSDEDIFEIFDYIQLPIEVEKIQLDYFTQNVIDLISVLNLR